MTNFWRTLVLLVVGLGAVWAATRIGSGPPTARNALDDTTATGDAAVTAPPAEADAPTEAEIEAQIRRAEVALGDRADPDQELPVDPLRADVAIALPSDI
jgi:hypothetical protein